MGNSASVHSAEVSFTGPNTITNPTTPLLLLAAPSVDTQPWRIAGTLGAEQEERQINRLAENIGSTKFALSAEDIATIDQLNEGIRACDNHAWLGTSVFA